MLLPRGHGHSHANDEDIEGYILDEVFGDSEDTDGEREEAGAGDDDEVEEAGAGVENDNVDGGGDRHVPGDSAGDSAYAGDDGGDVEPSAKRQKKN